MVETASQSKHLHLKLKSIALKKDSFFRMCALLLIKKTIVFIKIHRNGIDISFYYMLVKTMAVPYTYFSLISEMVQKQ